MPTKVIQPVVEFVEGDRMNKLESFAAWQHWKRYQPLLKELVVRDLKVKYRRSFLGYLWSLLNPLLMMAVMTLVFSYMFRFDIPNYPLYLICGQTLWNFFNESTNMALLSVTQNGSLIRKVYIPKFIFPLSRVVSCFVTMSFSLLAIVIVMIATGTPFHIQIILFPIPLLLLLVFSTGVGMMLSALSVYFRDIMHLYSVLTVAWMYATPIFYPLETVPEPIAAFIRMNPMYGYITFFRDLMLYGQVPPLSIWLMCLLSSLVALVLGLLIFRKLQRNFILYL